MTGGLRPYPEYRESGVTWLGRIPSRWDVVRMKYLLKEVDSRSTSGREILLSVSQYTGVTPRKKNDGDDGPATDNNK
jgi:type I restriction enzyme S subunit